MRRYIAIWTVAVALIFLAAPVAAQATFPKTTLEIHSGGATHKFDVEVAATSAQQAQGLMYRQKMAADAGMLFHYGRPQTITMWMKNTLIPLDMLFIDKNGKITHIRERAVPQSEELIPSKGRVTYVLELNGGTVNRLKIKVGDTMTYKR